MRHASRGRLEAARITIMAIVVAASLGAVILSASSMVRQRTLAGLEQRAAASAALHVALLQSEIARQRGLPLILSDDAELKATLDTPAAPRLHALSAKLENLGREVGAKVVYVLDRRGTAIAASNWRSTDSFVGSNYGFRPYFTDAMRDGAATYFALGTVSRHPGLYLAQRVGSADGPNGAVVVKVEFDALEASWKSLGDLAYIVDANGVVLITSIPQWRFATQAPLDPALLSALRRGRQFDHAAFPSLPLRHGIDGISVRRTDAAGGGARPLLDSAAAIPETTWTLHLLTPLAPAAQAERAARWIGVLLGSLGSVLVAWVWRRRLQAASVKAAAEANRLELERRVQQRTEELTEVNRHLRAEMDERTLTEVKLRALQSDLVQANKLASLGQIAAGVAHEINQPVAAIRTYADNAAVLLDRGRHDEVRSNLGVIGAMTERVGRITDELRAFGRKATTRIEPTSVAEAIEGSLLLTVSRSRQSRVELVRRGPATTARVHAERVRLEQVLVNLLQNAFEAVDRTENPSVAIAVEESAAEVRIVVQDNGPGLSPEVMQTLFTPFATTKPHGLGLGLIISRDILVEFGGRLIAGNIVGASGAEFVVVLRKVTTR